MNWQKGIAFIHGINMFSSNRINKEEMFGLCKKIENKDINILRIIKTDNIIFKKKNIHYATVGGLIEKILSDYFNKKMVVTTRSLATIKVILRNEE